MLTRRQIACQIYAFCKVNDVEGRAIGMNDLLHSEVRNDNLKKFEQAFEEILMAAESELKHDLLVDSRPSTFGKGDSHEDTFGAPSSEDRTPRRTHIFLSLVASSTRTLELFPITHACVAQVCTSTIILVMFGVVCSIAYQKQLFIHGVSSQSSRSSS